ncbi:hypothetical protein Gotri_025657 [Gossypium trilobum]|uniref:Uncharacterized protein n=1 Tax=Gossypium trilobum TaxID=34281 RepID=A0A7J9FNS4_9ROSI|nr:hypothetical protein [Gossypium trilobum]
MGDDKELTPSKYDMNAKWDACIDLTLRRFVYSSLAGAFGGLLFFMRGMLLHSIAANIYSEYWWQREPQMQIAAIISCYGCYLHLCCALYYPFKWQFLRPSGFLKENLASLHVGFDSPYIPTAEVAPFCLCCKSPRNDEELD